MLRKCRYTTEEFDELCFEFGTLALAVLCSENAN